MIAGTRVVVMSSNRRHIFNGGWATVTDYDPPVGLSKSIPVHFDDIPPNNTYRFPPECVYALFVIQEEDV